MGFKNKKPVFTPLDLNEENVQTIFKRCLPDDTTSETQGLVLFHKVLGFNENSSSVCFDKEKIEKNRQQITYLYGQLNDTFQKKNKTTPVSASTKYTGEHWSKSPDIIIKFLQLGTCLNLIYPFLAETKEASLNNKVTPTLSPKDPHFSDWWEQHKSEWETTNK